jgi:hypothetical protein
LYLSNERRLRPSDAQVRQRHPPIFGMLRGLVHNGVIVDTGLKSVHVGPRDVRESCRLIFDKALAIGGGVLEAVLMAITSSATP